MKDLPTPDEIQNAIHDSKRLEAVRDTGMLDSPREAAFDELIQEASRLLNAPLALVTLVDEYRDFVTTEVGLPEPYASAREIVDGPSFCELTIAQDAPVVINDTSKVSMLQLFPSVRAMGVKAHLGIPLRVDNQPVGNCCVIDYKPREWSDEDVAKLTRLAKKIMQQMSERLKQNKRAKA